MSEKRKSLADIADETSAAFIDVLLKYTSDPKEIAAAHELFDGIFHTYTLSFFAYHGMKAYNEVLLRTLKNANVQVSPMNAEFFRDADVTFGLLDIHENKLIKIDSDELPIAAHDEIGRRIFEAVRTELRNTVAKVNADVRRQQSRAAAAAKQARDPKQAAKTEAFKLWTDRHAGKHPNLRTNEQFAAECMRRWPVLTSAKVILGWCTDWNKAAKVRKPQSAS